MRNNQHRNITLSTKVSALQKAELVKIAQSHDITLSEFILSIIDTYKHKYGKENEPSKNELKLKEENDSLKKKNVRLFKDRESADYRVGLLFLQGPFILNFNDLEIVIKCFVITLHIIYPRL